MKKGAMMNIRLFFLLLFASVTAYSQLEEIAEGQEQDLSNRILVGPCVGESFGSNIVLAPEGRQNGVAFGSTPNLSLMAKVPVMKNANVKAIGILGYDNYPFQVKDYFSGEKYNHNISYFTLTALIDFEGMLFGFTYGTPLSANNGTKISTSSFNDLAEVKFGGNFVLLEDESSEFNVYFTLGYMLSNMYDNFSQNDPLKTKIPAVNNQKITEEFNPRLASLTINFNYLFNVGSIKF